MVLPPNGNASQRMRYYVGKDIHWMVCYTASVALTTEGHSCSLSAVAIGQDYSNSVHLSPILLTDT